MSTPVSVLMSVRNEEQFLPDALASLLKQSFSDFEIILVDDASIDRTPDIIRTFATRDKRIKPLRNPSRLGLTRSLNRALEAASGPLIARLDGDDIACEDRLERQAAFMTSHADVVLSGTGVALINADGNTQREFPDGLSPHAFRWTALGHSPIVHSTAMFRADAARALGGYDPRFAVAQDFDLWRRLLHQGDGACLSGIGARHRVHDESVSATQLDAQIRAIEEIAFACLLEQPSLRAAAGDVRLYRAFLSAMHGSASLVSDLAEQTRVMLDALVDAFSALYAVDAAERAVVARIAQSWCEAATRRSADAAYQVSDA